LTNPKPPKSTSYGRSDPHGPHDLSTPDGLELRINVPSGAIAVRATESDETRLEIDGERSPDDLRVTFDPIPSGGSRLTVLHKAKGLFGHGWHELDVRVVVPLGTVLEVETGSGDLEAQGELGDVAFRSGSGDARLGDVTGDLTVKVASGDLAAGSVTGDVKFHGASGDAFLSSVGGGLVARTASGDLRVTSVAGSVQATTVSGDIHIGALAGGSVNLRTVSGDVELGVAQERKVFLDLLSTSGDVQSDLGEDVERAEGPDLELTVVSVSGDVHVRRASIPSDAAI
jgi:putative adhesin